MNKVVLFLFVSFFWSSAFAGADCSVNGVVEQVTIGYQDREDDKFNIRVQLRKDDGNTHVAYAHKNFNLNDYQGAGMVSQLQMAASMRKKVKLEHWGGGCDVFDIVTVYFVE